VDSRGSKRVLKGKVSSPELGDNGIAGVREKKGCRKRGGGKRRKLELKKNNGKEI